MKKYAVMYILLVLLIISTPYCAKAQILDDDPTAETASVSDSDEALFNEIFSDYPETERDITNVKTFNDAISKTAAELKKTDILDESAPILQELPPLTGNMTIGLKKGSFTIFRNISGKTKCSFIVTLKSDLDREIRIMGLNLIFPHRTFAYVFRKVPAHGSQDRKITTTGDICYNMEGAPDISIHSCKIKGTPGSECAKRITWTTDTK